MDTAANNNLFILRIFLGSPLLPFSTIYSFHELCWNYPGLELPISCCGCADINILGVASCSFRSGFSNEVQRFAAFLQYPVSMQSVNCISQSIFRLFCDLIGQYRWRCCNRTYAAKCCRRLLARATLASYPGLQIAGGRPGMRLISPNILENRISRYSSVKR